MRRDAYGFSPNRRPSRTLYFVALVNLVLLANGCAMQRTVERQSVEYNTAVAGMANQLTLLNIVRAEEDLPIFYTTISRITGQAVVTTMGGFNAQIKASSPVDTSSVSTAIPDTTAVANTTMSGGSTSYSNAVPPTAGTPGTGTIGTTGGLSKVVTTTTGPTITDLASRAVTSGGNVYMPSITGQVVSGPTFDINILDTQAFYQGVLAEIPFSTMDNYIDQDYDNQLLIRLLVDRLEFSLKIPVPGYSHPAGTLVKVLRNVATGKTVPNDEAEQFAEEVACFSISGRTEKKAPKAIAPLSRVTSSDDGNVRSFKIKDLATLEEQKLDIDRPIPSDPARDRDVMLTRASAEKRVAHIELLKTCEDPIRVSDTPPVGPLPTHLSKPTTPPADTLYAGSGLVSVLADDGNSSVDVPADIRLVFRSPEGVIKFLGQYVYGSEHDPDHTYRLGSQPLFSVKKGKGSGAIVSTKVLGKHYYIADDENRRRNMTIIALVEQLVNLQKSATDRLVTVPVQVVP